MGKLHQYCIKNFSLLIAAILVINLIIRLVIYFSTSLFYFGDYSSYLSSIKLIESGTKVSLVNGNFLSAISYLGYFLKFISGSINFFFIFNSILGTATTLVIFILLKKITGSPIPGIIAAIIHTVYTEFMVFSTVFYTPILMLFILSLFVLLLHLYYTTEKKRNKFIIIILLCCLSALSMFFKPELVFLPVMLLIIIFCFIKKDRRFAVNTILLAGSLALSTLLIYFSGFLRHPSGEVTSNSFIFFGHTDYGGDGGEGSFVYEENKARYNSALKDYCERNNIDEPSMRDQNKFRVQEIKKFITKTPFKWVKIQFIKFFRTFGIVPESTSFKILFTGFLRGNLWLTSIIVVAPVALIIIFFILFFNLSSLRKLFNSSTFQSLNDNNNHISTLRPGIEQKKHFLYIYCLLFFYYVFSTIFFGQYQERYRMPVMIVFIIPVLGYFMATFNRKNFFNRTSLTLKSAVIVLFLAVWVFQAKKAISNKVRLNNSIESVKDAIK